MKHRVRLDLAFKDEADANSLVEFAKKFATKATSINEGKDSEEIGYLDYELCGHDEGKVCQKIERVETRS